MRWRDFTQGRGEKRRLKDRFRSDKSEVEGYCWCMITEGVWVLLLSEVIAVMTSSGFKVDFEKFDDKKNFTLW